MLRNSQYLEGCVIGAIDGPIGKVKALYFDGEAWVIRHLEYEMQYLKYYRYPSYRGRTGLWGVTERDRQKTGRRQHDNPHLRSCNAVMKYHTRATDGDIGHVHALLVDDETWAIRYLIVETSNWWLGHQTPQWIDDVSWFDRKVSVDLTRQAVKDAPPYDAEVSLDREQEMGIHEHYGRPGYWTGEVKSGAAG